MQPLLRAGCKLLLGADAGPWEVPGCMRVQIGTEMCSGGFERGKWRGKRRTRNYRSVVLPTP